MLDLEQITNVIKVVALDYPIKRASVFGSYADGTATEASDVDLLVEFQTATVSLFLLSELRMRIEELLSKSVDLIHAPLPKDAMIKIEYEVPVYEA